MDKEKKEVIEVASSLNAHPQFIQKSQTQFPKKQFTKEDSILEILKNGKSLNRFEAERYGDHCLHSTISTLKKKGAMFRAIWERVPTRFGVLVRVKRYFYIGMESEVKPC